MNICFITAGPIEWASSRMRAYWVAEEIEKLGHNVSVQLFDQVTRGSIGLQDAYIWQKKVDIDLVEYLGGDHYWDVCDPSWWWQPNECREIAKHMTAVVASTSALADDFNSWYGSDLAITIKDRLKMSHFHTKRQHSDVSPVRFVWFGIAANRIALWAAKADMERLVANGHKIELTILDDRPDAPFRFSEAFPIYHTLWQLQNEVEILSSHDIALLPPYPGSWGHVKSDNKIQTALACGIPAVGKHFTFKEIEELVTDVEYRRICGEIYEGCEVEQSAIEWEKLLCS